VKKTAFLRRKGEYNRENTGMIPDESG